MRAPSSTLPPWPARCEADNEAMYQWLNPKLENMGVAKIDGRPEDDEDDSDTECWLEKRDPATEKIEDYLPAAIEDAEHGDIEGLRAVLIELAKDDRVGRFVNLPKQPKGKRWPREREIYDPVEFGFCERERIRWAADDVFRIRSLWRKYYGRQRRRASDGWSAEKFAARRWNVSEPQISARLKKVTR
jgi:hypothetical protein